MMQTKPGAAIPPDPPAPPRRTKKRWWFGGDGGGSGLAPPRRDKNDVEGGPGLRLRAEKKMVVCAGHWDTE